jgi:hypothetical protein
MLFGSCNWWKDEDAGMATWWVAPQVTDPAVEGEQEPALIRCCRHDDRVTLAGELLIDDRVDVVVWHEACRHLELPLAVAFVASYAFPGTR